jgi:hypothetical protein
MVNLTRVALLGSLIGVMAWAALGQSNTANDRVEGKNMHGLIVYGQGFAFLASEPNDWDTDTGQVAREYGVNAIFFPRAQSSRSHHVTIRVRLNSKTTEDPQQNMTFDMNQYKKQYPSTQFTDLAVKHPDYPTATKLFYTRNEFYEYVAYVNPGSQFNLVFSVAMSKEKEAATQDELAAFDHVLRSLKFVTQDVQGPPKQ